MGTQWGQIVKEESKRSKGIGEYTKCQSEVFAYSSLLLLAASGLSYGLLQHKQFKNIPLKNRFLTSALFGVFSAWYFARIRTRYCQELWMVLEDKVPKEGKKKRLEEELE